METYISTHQHPDKGPVGIGSPSEAMVENASVRKGQVGR